jgi:hypothetical protein
MAGAAPPEAPAVAPQVVSSVRLFALCLVASVVSAALPLPWAAAASVFLVVGLVAGVRALVALVRAGRRPGVVAVVSCLIALAGLLLLGELARLAFWPAYWDRQQCLRAAITETGEQECEEDFRSRLVSGLLPTTR